MAVPKHEFTKNIDGILEKNFGANGKFIFKESELLQYINIKTKAANRGSKSRAGFANHYALYVLIEDYTTHKFHESGNYEKYDGAIFSDLFKRQRELPFGSKLQNHALNHRLNEEFHKYFPTCDFSPIIRDVESNRYWINENLLKVKIGKKVFNLAETIKEIIEAYIKARQKAFNEFMVYCEEMIKIQEKDYAQATKFVSDLLQPNVDARVFEIVSYAILKEFYADQMVFWGWSEDALNQEALILYKTGRTNANDGGIGFVMKPLGRFFQVTETIDAGKYFLDIDKVQRYPITFVVKSEASIQEITAKVEEQAKNKYHVKRIVEKYMDCIEEIVNIPILLDRFKEVMGKKRIEGVIHEIVLQSKLEFNVYDETTMPDSDLPEE